MAKVKVGDRVLFGKVRKGTVLYKGRMFAKIQLDEPRAGHTIITVTKRQLKKVPN